MINNVGGCYSASSCGDSDYEKFAKQYPGNHYQTCCETGELLNCFKYFFLIIGIS